MSTIYVYLISEIHAHRVICRACCRGWLRQKHTRFRRQRAHYVCIALYYRYTLYEFTVLNKNYYRLINHAVWTFFSIVFAGFLASFMILDLKFILDSDDRFKHFFGMRVQKLSIWTIRNCKIFCPSIDRSVLEQKRWTWFTLYRWRR